jgi:hypothetical protein
MDKDDWRHFLSGIAAGQRAVPGYNDGEGRRGIVMIGKSSLKLTKAQATEAIRIGLDIGNKPDEQGLRSPPVRWSRAVLLGDDWNPKDLEQ